MDGNVIIREHLYLTEDRTRVVKEGDPASRWLWAAPGTEVSLREAIRLGAVKPEPAEEQASEADPLDTEPPADEEPAEPKAAKQAPNKARKPAANKAASTGEGE
ncbi:hypothetical protein Rhe02_54830 [Rhizocola hellebori]|uniref:Uncharacterized protein n=1 Tax=Rhizocola hellebori TaxID=1392758 RepID=A0A8J3QDM7_9ACTN|nr:hypothetical protein [Rhizocola hellebori]GIH07416.1 hypothetical protein Rhe02_54830 [Rhizocola hellebori]